jgi:hypothetical protein
MDAVVFYRMEAAGIGLNDGTGLLFCDSLHILEENKEQ